MKINILAIAAHPDDVELCCAGTLLRHMELGLTAGILDLTAGELGTRGSGPLRLQESRAAAEVLELTIRENLGLPDGFFENNKENQLAIARVIRRYKPDIILANAPVDRHPDHRRAAILASDACFVAGLVKVPIEDDGVRQEAWRPRVIYHYIQNNKVVPDLCIDVTPYMDRRMEAVRCFKSQFYDPASEEPESPISTKAFLDQIIGSAAYYGQMIGVPYAEAFTVQRPIAANDLRALY